MAIETELKLNLPPQAARRLPGHPLLAGVESATRRLVNQYYDTDDLALLRSGIGVRPLSTSSID
ncbi:MAG: hypothetical protein RBT86_06825 [Azospira sp.]|jgi:inorganic triphosphatase YgiF|nr:hypothetical protein [Azospira sp.]